MGQIIKLALLCIIGGVIGLVFNIVVLRLQDIAVVYSLIGFSAALFTTLAYYQIRKEKQ